MIEVSDLIVHVLASCFLFLVLVLGVLDLLTTMLDAVKGASFD